MALLLWWCCKNKQKTGIIGKFGSDEIPFGNGVKHMVTSGGY
jgi:hypothetical protein